MAGAGLPAARCRGASAARTRARAGAAGRARRVRHARAAAGDLARRLGPLRGAPDDGLRAWPAPAGRADARRSHRAIRGIALAWAHRSRPRRPRRRSGTGVPARRRPRRGRAIGPVRRGWRLRPSSPARGRISGAPTMEGLSSGCGRGRRNLDAATRFGSPRLPWTGGSKRAVWRWWRALRTALPRMREVLTRLEALRALRPPTALAVAAGRHTPRRCSARPWRRRRTSATRCRCISRMRGRWPIRCGSPGLPSRGRCQSISSMASSGSRSIGFAEARVAFERMLDGPYAARAALGLGAARERLEDGAGACAAYRRAAADGLVGAAAERARQAADRLKCPPG